VTKGHNGWGATGSGSIPRATFTLDLPKGETVMQFGLIASEVVRAAKELNVTPREAIDVLRYASILDCTDEQADAVVALLATQSTSERREVP
jgi:hypothetical protein